MEVPLPARDPAMHGLRGDNHIYSAILQGFIPLQNSSENLDPSYKTNVDFWGCIARMLDELLAILRPFQQFFSHYRTMGR